MRFDPSLRHRLRLSSIYFVCEFEANRSSRSPTIAILPKVVFALERQGFESSAGLLFCSELRISIGDNSASRGPIPLRFREDLPLVLVHTLV